MGNLAYEDERWDELIDGKLVMMSPRPAINHNRISANIHNIFYTYLKGKPCEVFADGVDLYLSATNRFIPDCMVVCDKSKVKVNGIYGAPDLVVEVLSPGTAKNDRSKKKQAYEAAGVKEYWIANPADKTVEIYLLQNGQLELDNVYSILPDYALEQMTEDEKAHITTEFKCSLYGDLLISLDDVFYNVD